MNDEGLADVVAASPFRLPRLHAGSRFGSGSVRRAAEGGIRSCGNATGGQRPATGPHLFCAGLDLRGRTPSTRHRRVRSTLLQPRRTDSGDDSQRIPDSAPRRDDAAGAGHPRSDATTESGAADIQSRRNAAGGRFRNQCRCSLGLASRSRAAGGHEPRLAPSRLAVATTALSSRGFCWFIFCATLLASPARRSAATPVSAAPAWCSSMASR